MSKYTTELRFICEHSAGLTESAGYESIDEVLDNSRDKIFDFDFPIFDESYRNVLENKILKHYYTREICCETVGRWKLFLNTKMNEIMPYYNQLYKSAVIEFNPMYDVDLTTNYQKVDNGNRNKTGTFTENGNFSENGSFSKNGSFNESGSVNEEGTLNETITNNETIEGESNSTGTSTKTDNTTINTTVNDNSETTVTEAKKNDHWEYFSDTPEGGINGVEDLSYLTNATHITDDGTGSTSTSDRDSTTTTETSNVTTSNGSTTDNTTTSTDKTGTITKQNSTTKEGTNESKGTNNSMGTNESEGTSEKTGNNTSNEVIRNTEDYLHHVIGKSAGVSYSKLLKEYRDTFINIDMMIIKDLRNLFMNIW